MIASGIFFVAMFAILGLVAQTLRNARILRSTRVDAGMIAAQLTLTNKLFEGSESGDFGDYYHGYSWISEDNEVMSNGLHQVEFGVIEAGAQGSHSTMTIYLYRPESPPGRMSGAFGPPLGR
jgi:hypothetical protein